MSQLAGVRCLYAVLAFCAIAPSAGDPNLDQMTQTHVTGGPLEHWIYMKDTDEGSKLCFNTTAGTDPCDDDFEQVSSGFQLKHADDWTTHNRETKNFGVDWAPVEGAAGIVAGNGEPKVARWLDLQQEPLRGLVAGSQIKGAYYSMWADAKVGNDAEVKCVYTGRKGSGQTGNTGTYTGKMDYARLTLCAQLMYEFTNGTVWSPDSVCAVKKRVQVTKVKSAWYGGFADAEQYANDPNRAYIVNMLQAIATMQV